MHYIRSSSPPLVCKLLFHLSCLSISCYCCWCDCIAAHTRASQSLYFCCGVSLFPAFSLSHSPSLFHMMALLVGFCFSFLMLLFAVFVIVISNKRVIVLFLLFESLLCVDCAAWLDWFFVCGLAFTRWLCLKVWLSLLMFAFPSLCLLCVCNCNAD